MVASASLADFPSRMSYLEPRNTVAANRLTPRTRCLAASAGRESGRDFAGDEFRAAVKASARAAVSCEARPGKAFLVSSRACWRSLVGSGTEALLRVGRGRDAALVWLFLKASEGGNLAAEWTNGHSRLPGGNRMYLVVFACSVSHEESQALTCSGGGCDTGVGGETQGPWGRWSRPHLRPPGRVDTALSVHFPSSPGACFSSLPPPSFLPPTDSPATGGGLSSSSAAEMQGRGQGAVPGEPPGTAGT